MQYVHLQKHVASHRWQFDSLNIGRCPVLRDFLMFLALVRHRTLSGRAPLESYDIFYTKIVRCPSDVCKRRPGTVWCPAFYPQWPYQTPYGRRGILSSTLTSRAPYDVLKMFKKSFDSSFRRPGAVRVP